MAQETIPGIASVSFDEADAILIISMAEKSNINFSAAEKITEVASRLSGDSIHGNLVDMRNMTFMSSDARKHFGGQTKQSVCAVAVVSNPGFHKPLINLYLKFSRPYLPTRFFDNEDQARAWLKESIRNK
jgi:hypothetical protein